MSFVKNKIFCITKDDLKKITEIEKNHLNKKNKKK